MNSAWEPEQERVEGIGPDGAAAHAHGSASMDGDANQVMDALVASGRVDGREIRDETEESRPLTNPEVGRIIRTIRELLQAQEELPARRRVTLTAIARAIGESISAVSQVLTYKYPAGKSTGYTRRDAILRKLDGFQAQHAARKSAPQRGPIAWTRVAEELRAVAQTAAFLDVMGAAFGPAGIGKTMTLQALAQTMPGSVLLTVDDSSRTVPSFFRKLCDLLKLRTAGRRVGMRDLIVQALIGTKRLLIVDEAHLAGLDVLNAARQLYDETGCPVLLVGLPALGRMLKSGRNDDARGATLYSRIGICRDLMERTRSGGHPGEPLYSAQDIREVFARSALRIAPDGLRWLEDLANVPDSGGLRSATNALRLAAQALRKTAEPDRPIDSAILEQAARLLHGIERAEQISTLVKQRRAVAV